MGPERLPSSDFQFFLGIFQGRTGFFFLCRFSTFLFFLGNLEGQKDMLTKKTFGKLRKKSSPISCWILVTEVSPSGL